MNNHAPTTQASIRRKGFSLAEVLIAIGILAIGMSLIAAVFPAALKITEDSANDSLGTIICENGIAMAKTALTSSITFNSYFANSSGVTNNRIDTKTPYGVLTLANQNYPLTQTNSTYPTGNEDEYKKSKFGYAILIRSINSETQQIVCTSYRRQDTSSGANVVWESINVMDTIIPSSKSESSSVEVSQTDFEDKIREGSPLIFNDGVFAVITSKYKDENDKYIVNLDRYISDHDGEHTCVLLEEIYGSSPVKYAKKSPAMSTMVVRTSLD